MIITNNEWDIILNDEYEKPYFLNLLNFLESEYANKTIYPPKPEIFNSLKLTSFNDVKVVILGQDPYHNPNEAHGVAFSVNYNVKIPPSLKNIFKELQDDIGINAPQSGNLTKWAKQGVLLLNTVLTVEKNKPTSHKNKGWEIFTDEIIKALNSRKKPVIFILWGSPAQKKEKLITNKYHYILKAPHPSPLSSYRGFFGCKHFSIANNIIKSHKETPIDWEL